MPGLIRASRPADVVRYGVFGGPAPGNRAYPLAAVGTEPSPAMSKREVMATVASLRSRGIHSLTLSHDRYVPAIVAARPRATVRCWEVTHLLADYPGWCGMSRCLRYPVSRDSASGWRARLSPPSRGRPAPPTCGHLRVHQVRRRGSADRPKGEFPRCVYPRHTSRKADRRTRPVPALQRLDAFTDAIRPGNDRRSVAGRA